MMRGNEISGQRGQALAEIGIVGILVSLVLGIIEFGDMLSGST